MGQDFGDERPAAAISQEPVAPLPQLPPIGYVYEEQDIPRLASLHRRAFPSFFLSSLGERFLSEFYRGFLDDPSAVVVLQRGVDGQPIGIAVGTTEPNGFFSRLIRRRLWGFLRAAAFASLRNPRAVPRLLRGATYRGGASTANDGALLSSICVDPDSEGGGHGRRLIEAWRGRAHYLGAKTAYLTTDAEGNDRTNQFYLSDGWCLSATFTTAEGREMNQYTVDLADLAHEQKKGMHA